MWVNIFRIIPEFRNMSLASLKILFLSDCNSFLYLVSAYLKVIVRPFKLDLVKVTKSATMNIFKKNIFFLNHF